MTLHAVDTGVASLQWPSAGALVDMDFAGNRYFARGQAVPITDVVKINQSSAGYVRNAAGLWVLNAANAYRRTDLGLWCDDTRTNVVLWNRDFTNAAWTKTNVAATKDQVGADGTPNAATRLTATAANATILQAITLASSARYQTAIVKRVTGSGTVQMTMDGGATWTTVSLTSSYARVAIATQTIANPSVGFRLVTSGDEIAVDFVQNENGTYPTSPIATTSAAVTRSNDNYQLIGAAQTALTANVAGAALIVTNAIDRTDSNAYALASSIATGGTAYYFLRFAATNDPTGGFGDGVSTRVDLRPGTFPGGSSANRSKFGISWDAAGMSCAANNGTVGTTTAAKGLNSIAGVNTYSIFLGGTGSNGTQMSGFVDRLAIYAFRPTDAALKALTS